MTILHKIQFPHVGAANVFVPVKTRTREHVLLQGQKKKQKFRPNFCFPLKSTESSVKRELIALQWKSSDLKICFAEQRLVKMPPKNLKVRFFVVGRPKSCRAMAQMGLSLQSSKSVCRLHCKPGQLGLACTGPAAH